MKILVIQGPNLNMLGKRESLHYTTTTLDEIHSMLREQALPLEAQLSFFQSNHEGAIVDRIHEAHGDGTRGILINAGAYTHTSIAIRDALLAAGLPFVEVHISNVYARETFRQHSYLSDVAAGLVVGFGPDGYRLGLLGLIQKIAGAK
ncbi:MAG: type II 3-dehydroquinate dehydratase [Spirochaetia bacterium]|nr:type II 3-dehydroquinate dehydratase [Spirochaetia bacterium]